MAEVKREMIRIAKRTILVMDASKVGKQFLELVTPFPRSTHWSLTTVSALSMRYEFEKRGLQVVVCEEVTPMMNWRVKKQSFRNSLIFLDVCTSGSDSIWCIHFYPMFYNLYYAVFESNVLTGQKYFVGPGELRPCFYRPHLPPRTSQHGLPLQALCCSFACRCRC